MSEGENGVMTMYATWQAGRETTDQLEVVPLSRDESTTLFYLSDESLPILQRPVKASHDQGSSCRAS